VPKIKLSDLAPMFCVAIIGALIAGGYGIAHDHVTYSIGPEYFTKFKFNQFGFADLGYSNRVFVTEIGFLATWWVGFVIAWFLARRLIPNQPWPRACRQIALGFAIVFVIGFLFGLLGFGYGVWRGPEGDYLDWEFATEHLDLTAIWPFVRVAYIHNASYLGGFVGFVVALILIRPSVRAPDAKP
jgi:hypothetical protein